MPVLEGASAEKKETQMKKTQVVLLDDIDGTEAEETVSFSFKGVSYELDLSSANAAAMAEDLEKWIKPARRVGGRTTTRSARSPKAKASSRAGEIRAWAQGQGLEVNERGRIPAEIVAAFEAAQA